MFISFSLTLARKEKETQPKKEKQRLSKYTVNDFIVDFSATSCCKNHLKIKLCLTNRASGLRPEPQINKDSKDNVVILSSLRSSE